MYYRHYSHKCFYVIEFVVVLKEPKQIGKNSTHQNP